MATSTLDEVAKWKMKKLLKKLKNYRGAGTSMITIIVPPNSAISYVSKMLTDESGAASNIKSKSNKQSVLQAITSIQARIKDYHFSPANGLAVYSGTIMEEGKEKRVTYMIEPIKPINTSMYRCGLQFYVDDLLTLFDNEAKYAFVVIDGHSTVFALLQGNVKTILMKIAVDLPKKHGRGGQSSVRFARLRTEKRLIYVKKISELMTQHYTVAAIPTVSGIVLAGHSDLKNEMYRFMDKELQNRVIKIVDTNYGGECGLNEAIDLSTDVLSDVRYSKEKQILKKFFTEMRIDTGKYCYGFKDTISCLESGAIETLIVWENCEIKHGDELFVDWIAEHYHSYGCNLEVISDKTEEGSQYIHGFGGVGGVLKYKVDLLEHVDEYEEISDDDIF